MELNFHRALAVQHRATLMQPQSRAPGVPAAAESKRPETGAFHFGSGRHYGGGVREKQGLVQRLHTTRVLLGQRAQGMARRLSA